MADPLSTTADGEDHLSALNDDILHKIIIYLPVMEAARTAVLAGRWRYLWSSSPLVLRDADLPEPARAALVPRVLNEHRGCFRSVLLTDCRFNSLERALPGWPRILADKGTRELSLVNRLNRNQDNIAPRLPAGILRSDSLEELSLDFWAFPAGLSRGAGISLQRLQRLDLLMITTSDQDLEYLIATCRDLKTLKLTTFDKNEPKTVRLRSGSLRCATVGPCRVEEFAVEEAPLLERLLLFLPGPGDGVRVKIGCAANLRVLGHLDTRVHSLQIGDSVIGVNTMASTRTGIPSVRILAVTVNLGVLLEVKTLVSFLRCFPNIDTLHIESALRDPSVAANEPSGQHHAGFWQEVSVSRVECLRSHVKKMVIHEFRGDQSEFEFLEFIAMYAQELQSLHAVLQEENVSSIEVVDEIKGKLQSLQFQTGISGVLLVKPEVGTDSSLQTATDLTFDDPFRF